MPPWSHFMKGDGTENLSDALIIDKQEPAIAIIGADPYPATFIVLFRRSG